MIPLTLQLDWLPNAQFAGILLAQDAGWYKKAGINLEIVPWRAYLNQVDVLRQQGNIVVSTDDNLLVKAAIQGEPVLALAAMLQYSGLAYMILKERNIRRFEELRGKRIGIHTDGRTGIAVVLDHVGMSTDDVDVVEVGFEYDELLRSGELDAMQCLAMVEPIELADRGFDLDLFMAKDLGYLAYAQVIASNQDTMAREPDMLRAFLDITFDGWRSAFEDPERAARIICTHHLPDAKVALQRRMIETMEPLFLYAGGREGMGRMEPARWRESVRIVGLEGHEIGGLDIKTFVDFTYSDMLEARVGGEK